MKFASSITSEPESLSLSRYRTPSDASSLQQFDVDKAFPQKIDFKQLNGPSANQQAPLYSHQVGQNELQSMFVREEYCPNSVSMLMTIAGLAIGVGIGILLSKTEASNDVVDWVALPGDLYLDALVCVVVPGVFCSIVMAVSEIVNNNSVRKVAAYTALWFTISAVLAAAIGTLFAGIFASTFTTQTTTKTADPPALLAFKCASENFLFMAKNGSVSCSGLNSQTNNTLFTVKETEPFFERTATEFSTFTLTDQVVGILSSMVPTNVLDGFVNSAYVSVVFTAFFFSVACTNGHDTRRGVPNYVLLLISQGAILFRMIINVLLRILPVAVISLVAGSIGNNQSQIDALNDIVYLVLALCAAGMTFIFVVMGGLLFLITRRNVVTYLRHIVPAQTFALGCSSTLATLPMTIRCVDTTNEVDRPLARVVLAFGSTCNFTATSMYVPLAVVFLARISGLGDELTAGKYVLIFLMSAVSSFGSAASANADLVMVITVWKAVFNENLVPLFSTLVATDWLLNRIRTLIDVTVHSILARIVHEQCRDTTPGAFVIDSEGVTPSDRRNNDF